MNRPIKTPEERVKLALESLGDFMCPVEKPADLEEYDAGAETAAEIAGFALALLTAARDLMADREKFRSDFVSDLREAATTKEELHGVAGQFSAG